MEPITLQGPVVVMSENDYRDIVNRISRLEKTVLHLAQLLEDREDIRAMREAEAEYLAGDQAHFDDLLAEIEAESDSVSS